MRGEGDARALPAHAALARPCLRPSSVNTCVARRIPAGPRSAVPARGATCVRSAACRAVPVARGAPQKERVKIQYIHRFARCACGRRARHTSARLSSGRRRVVGATPTDRPAARGGTAARSAVSRLRYEFRCLPPHRTESRVLRSPLNSRSTEPGRRGLSKCARHIRVKSVAPGWLSLQHCQGLDGHAHRCGSVRPEALHSTASLDHACRPHAPRRAGRSG